MAKKEKTFVDIKVKNWEKYNPTRGNKANFWFRLNNDFFHDESIFGAGSMQIATLLVLFCSCSRAKSEHVRVSLEQIAFTIGTRKDNIIKALDALNLRGLILYSTPTYKHTNKRNSNTAETSNSNSFEGITPDRVIELWNSQDWSYRNVSGIIGAWREDLTETLTLYPDEKTWNEIFSKVRASPYLMGKVKHNGKKCRFQFSWITKAETVDKILNNYYSGESQYEFTE